MRKIIHLHFIILLSGSLWDGYAWADGDTGTKEDLKPSSSIQVRTSLPKSIVAIEAENNPLTMKEPSAVPGDIAEAGIEGVQGKRFGVILDRPVHYQGKAVQSLPIDSYMSMKFDEINKRLLDLEQRTGRLEKDNGARNDLPNQSGKPESSLDGKNSGPKQNQGQSKQSNELGSNPSVLIQ